MNQFYTILGEVVFLVSISILIAVFLSFVWHKIKRKRWVVFCLDWFSWNFRRKSIKNNYSTMGIGALQSVHEWLKGRKRKTRYSEKHRLMVEKELNRREVQDGN